MTAIDRRSLLLGAGASLVLAGCGRAPEEAAFAPAPGKAGRLLAAARRQIGVTTSWNGNYAVLPFPGGDVPRDASGWRPGDIFTSLVENRSTHIGLVSDRRGADGWLIIHNIGLGTREENALGDWPVTGRYRWGLA